MPHVDQLRESMSLLVHYLLRPLDGLHELLLVVHEQATEGARDGSLMCLDREGGGVRICCLP